MKLKSNYQASIERVHKKNYDKQIDIATDRDNRIKRAAELTNSCSARTKALATPKSEPTLRQRRKSYKSSNENITTPNRLQNAPIYNRLRTPVRTRTFTRKSGMNSHPRTPTTPNRTNTPKSCVNSHSRIPTTPVRTFTPTSCCQPKIPSSLSSSGHLRTATPTKTDIASSIATPPLCESKEFLAQQKTPSNCESVAKIMNSGNITFRRKQRTNGTPCNQFTRSQTPLRSPAL